jgi:hypothetical protein
MDYSITSEALFTQFANQLALKILNLRDLLMHGGLQLTAVDILLILLSGARRGIHDMMQLVLIAESLLDRYVVIGCRRSLAFGPGPIALAVNLPAELGYRAFRPSKLNSSTPLAINQL